MYFRPVARTVLAVVGVVSLAACHSKSTKAGATPAPAAAPRTVAAAPKTPAPAPTRSGPAAKAAPASKLPEGVTAAMVALGDSLFNNATCQRCHGKGAAGGANAPSLVRTTWDHGSGSYDDIVKTIMTGVTKEQLKDPTRPFAMRARGGGTTPLTDDQVKAVAAYVYSLNHK